MGSDPASPTHSTTDLDQAGHAFGALGMGLHYLIIITVHLYRTGPSTFAIESAFAEHLRLLRRRLAPEIGHITVAAPTLSSARYAQLRNSLAEIDEPREGISFVPLFPGDATRAEFWRRFPHTLRTLWREIERAHVVHGGLSHDLYRPFEFVGLVLAMARKKKTIVVEDIDLRNEASMHYMTGRWPRRTYLVNRYIYDRVRAAQRLLAARHCSLALYKGAALAADYGGGRASVHNFLDVAFFADQIIPPDRLRAKTERIVDPEHPLALIYFGRLTAYKGVDHCLTALAHARALGATRVHFTILGAGEEEANLRQMTTRLGLEAYVTFLAAVPFGPRLFEHLYESDLLLAAPLSEDTPRSALDAMAAGTPILAYDTYYYRDLSRSGAVTCVPWNQPERLGSAILNYVRDRTKLGAMMQKAAAFAAENTQEIWIDRRVAWTKALLQDRGVDTPENTSGFGRSARFDQKKHESPLQGDEWRSNHHAAR